MSPILAFALGVLVGVVIAWNMAAESTRMWIDVCNELAKHEQGGSR